MDGWNWLTIPGDASTANYYTLAMISGTGGDVPVGSDQTVRQGDLVKLALRSEERVH